ncbi:ABC transporter permease [Thermodesulfobacteriota bacterium]
MSFEFFIGSRYLRAKRKQAFISLITILSTAGVTVGVMALMVVIAVMTGAESDFRSRILGVESHAVVMRHGGRFHDYRQIAKQTETVAGVSKASPFIYSQIMLRSSSGVSGAVLRGIDPNSTGQQIKNVSQLSLLQKTNHRDEKKTPASPPGIILGKELARTLGVLEGDSIYLISPRGLLSPIGHVPSMKRFRVVARFESGFYEYDGSMAYIHLTDAQKMLRMGDTVSGIEVRVNDIYKADVIAKKIITKLGFPYWARDWMQMNRNLFSALKLEKKARKLKSNKL